MTDTIGNRNVCGRYGVPPAQKHVREVVWSGLGMRILVIVGSKAW